MEKRINKLEEEFWKLQKVLYKMEVSLESIAKQIWTAVNLKEDVIRLEEKQMTLITNLIHITNKVEDIEKNVVSVQNKLAWYGVGITILAIAVPYIIQIILN